MIGLLGFCRMMREVLVGMCGLSHIHPPFPLSIPPPPLPQAHYDWGLRAIKSVLVVAGTLKRDEPQYSEDRILMRALRDFNLPKIVAEDRPVFLNLISDLFPGLDLDRKVDASFEAAVERVTLAAGLQADPAFVLKVVQLKEILDVRHSVFVIGPSGSGKTEVWKALAATFTELGRKTIYRDLNPKAVSPRQLFGYKNKVTKEPIDGLFSDIMRRLANMEDEDPKWIVLDGDIDTLWIESLNTVMDDNKVGFFFFFFFFFDHDLFFRAATPGIDVCLCPPFN